MRLRRRFRLQAGRGGSLQGGLQTFSRRFWELPSRSPWSLFSAAQAPGGTSSASASQAASVMIVSNDTFAFGPGIGADVIANAGSTDTIELDGFSSVTSNTQLAA